MKPDNFSKYNLLNEFQVADVIADAVRAIDNGGCIILYEFFDESIEQFSQAVEMNCLIQESGVKSEGKVEAKSSFEITIPSQIFFNIGIVPTRKDRITYQDVEYTITQTPTYKGQTKHATDSVFGSMFISFNVVQKSTVRRLTDS